MKCDMTTDLASNQLEAWPYETLTQLHFITLRINITMVTTRGKQSKTASVPVTLSQDTQGEALIGATINPSKFPVWIQCLRFLLFRTLGSEVPIMLTALNSRPFQGRAVRSSSRPLHQRKPRDCW